MVAIQRRFTTSIGDIRAIEIQRIAGSKANEKPRFKVAMDGQEVNATKRFWSSLTSRYSTYGISMNLFKSGMFTPEEVFERLAKVVKDGNVKYTIQDNVGGVDENGNPALPKLLAISDPGKPVISHDLIMEKLEGYNGEDTGATYLDGIDVDNLGIVRSTHTPKRLDNFKIASDEFMHKFTFEIPIDGYGKPKVFLSLLRLACENGMVGYAPCFTSEISAGRGEGDYMFAIERALDSFSNDEGFGALRERLDLATRSWASVAEACDVYKKLGTVLGSGHFLNKGTGNIADSVPDHTAIMGAWHKLTGDISATYGIAHTDAMSRKKQERLPVRCSVYDMFNFVTEVATHYVDDAAARSLHAIVGQKVGAVEEYDLQDSMMERPEFTDFFLDNDGKTLAGNRNAALVN